MYDVRIIKDMLESIALLHKQGKVMCDLWTNELTYCKDTIIFDNVTTFKSSEDDLRSHNLVQLANYLDRNRSKFEIKTSATDMEYNNYINVLRSRFCYETLLREARMHPLTMSDKKIIRTLDKLVLLLNQPYSKGKVRKNVKYVKNQLIKDFQQYSNWINQVELENAHHINSGNHNVITMLQYIIQV